MEGRKEGMEGRKEGMKGRNEGMEGWMGGRWRDGGRGERNGVIWTLYQTL